VLIWRQALQVGRIALKPEDGVNPADSTVFVDDTARVAATDGRCFLRVEGAVEAPSLFATAELPIESADQSPVGMPSDVVLDFLRATPAASQAVVSHTDGATVLATVDGVTAREFRRQGGADEKPVTPPNFDRVLPTMPPLSVTVSVDLLLKLTRTLKAMGADAVTLGITDAEQAIRLDAAVLQDGEQRAVEGALMPMRT